ncbi:PDZ domain-containing protein [Streptomyces sp. NPDC101150]|uniref:S41 family peptidase n=1 Tax=Streptomyces sp. NPDC101150 TaxID=3366114 RepID=UPI00380BA3A6
MSALSAASGAYLRFPHVRGDLLTFTAEDDVWTCAASGGRARRLSADRVPVSHPRISPDGAWIAWTSSRDGAPEVWLAPAAGGPARRLTYWGDRRTRVAGWTPAGDVLAITAAGEPSARRPWAWRVPVDGNPPERLPYGPVGGLALGPGGAALLQTPVFVEAAYWKRYRGGTAGRLWIDPAGSGEFTRLHPGLDGNLECPLWAGGRVAFLSDHTGCGQLWSSLPDGGDLRRHTGHDGYARHAATDGAGIVYQCAGDLWRLPDLDPATATERIAVTLGGPRTALAPHRVPAAGNLGGFAPDHTGRAGVVEIRGAVHRMPHDDGPVTALGVRAGVRRRLARFLGDTGKVAWVSDAPGTECIEITGDAPQRGGEAPVRIGTGRFVRVLDLAASPDGTTLAVADLYGGVLLADVASGRVTEIDRSDAGDISGLVFSPDSAWVAWSHPGPEQLRQLRMARVREGSVIEATPMRFRDFSPAFTHDGRHLAFLSARDFAPVHQAHDFGMAFVGATRPHLLPLTATAPLPFGPGAVPAPDGGPQVAETTEVTVDTEGLADRATALPVASGTYRTLRATANGLLWIRDLLPPPAATDARAVLEGWDLAGNRSVELRTGVRDFQVSGDGTRVMVRTHTDALTVHPAAGGGAATAVDTDRIRAVVDPAAEWRQVFEEDARLLRDVSARTDLEPARWDAVVDRYRPLLARVGSYDDFTDLLWELHGELGMSHTNVAPRPRETDPSAAQGHLGADLEHGADGAWRIARIPRGEVSADGARSPLAAPGVGVRAGDVLLEIDGIAVGRGPGPGPLLTRTAGRRVELTLRSPAGTVRRVTVTPLAEERTLRYHDWVAARRDHVTEASDGRLGYLHLPDLTTAGWAQLHRDLRAEIVRDGLILDIRENAGGEMSEKVLELLCQRVSGWRVDRSGFGYAYPNVAPRGPVVLVADEFTGSDGDIMVWAVRHRGIGPVVGARTWGGFTAIEWQHSLMDGTGLLLPRFASWFEGPGWGAENVGIAPDTEVAVPPQDRVRGRDPQLDEAVRQALKLLDERPPAQVPRLGRRGEK